VDRFGDAVRAREGLRAICGPREEREDAIGGDPDVGREPLLPNAIR